MSILVSHVPLFSILKITALVKVVVMLVYLALIRAAFSVEEAFTYLKVNASNAKNLVFFVCRNKITTFSVPNVFPMSTQQWVDSACFAVISLMDV